MCSNTEKEVLLQVINLYKDRPFLWNKDHKDYYNKDVRAEGFKRIMEVYKTLDENVNLKTLKKKIENMRTNYTKELKKVLASKHEDDGAVYVPTLWYFNALSFLDDTTSDSRRGFRLADPLHVEHENMSSDEETKNKGSYDSFSIGQKRRKEELLIEKQEQETLIEKQGHLLETVERLVTNMSHKDQQWEVYGRAIGYQLKDISEDQLVICQKLISDAIFYAKTNRLNEYSRIVTRSDES